MSRIPYYRAGVQGQVYNLGFICENAELSSLELYYETNSLWCGLPWPCRAARDEAERRAGGS